MLATSILLSYLYKPSFRACGLQALHPVTIEQAYRLINLLSLNITMNTSPDSNSQPSWCRITTNALLYLLFNNIFRSDKVIINQGILK